MNKRKNGEGSWGKKTIKGVDYQYYRNADGKYFYGKTQREVKAKIENSDKNKITNKVTFAEYLLWYYENIHKNTVEETTYQTYLRICKTIIDSEYYNIGRIQLERFTKKDNYFQLYINAITEHYALNTIKGQMRIIKSAVKYAESNDMIEYGLVSALKTPKESNVGVKAKKIPFLSKNDAIAMYNESKSVYVSSEKPMYTSTSWAVLLLINTGLRIGELKALKWEDIDLVNKTLKVDESMARVQLKKKNIDDKVKYVNKIKITKTKSSNRIIPLNNIAMEMINNFQSINSDHKATDLVCVTKYKTTIKQQHITRTADRMLKRICSDIKHIGVHGLRHSFGSILYAQGVPLKTISKLLGHSSIVTTANIYIGIEDEHLVDTVKLLEYTEE